MRVTDSSGPRGALYSVCSNDFVAACIRLVDHTTWETLAQELRLDVHFAAVGGIGGVADACQLYRTLHIPVVVIADLDQT
jgi:hypothetical protein